MSDNPPSDLNVLNERKKMKTPRMLLFVTVLLGASLLAACGKGAPANENPKSSDACSLLTKEDVGKILGQAVEEVTGKGLGGVCTYTTKNSRFELTVTHTGGTQYMQGLRAKLGQSALDFPGVGDEAFYNPNSYTLIVRKGDVAYLINFYDSSHQLSDEDKQAKQKALAQQLLSKLH